MKEQFVTYEIALKLKKLGFDEVCLAKYISDETLVFGRQISQADSSYYDESDFSAPLWQQAFDFCLGNIQDKLLSIIFSKTGSIYISYYKYGAENYAFEFKTKEECLIKLIELCKNEIKNIT